MHKYTDNLKNVVFTSAYDGTQKYFLLSLPLDYKKYIGYPLIISPSPFGWSHFENFTLGPADQTELFKGWTGISDKYKVIIVLPLGHGKTLERVSLAWEGQLEEIRLIPKYLEEMEIKIDSNKIYICGQSMGGMETMSAMGRYPNFFKAGFSFNGISDLALWYEDIKNGKTDKTLNDFGALDLIEKELGGTPEKIPQEYKKRSAINYIDGLRKVNLMLYWSSKDSIVVNQSTRQSKKLFSLIKKKYPNSNINEHDHTDDHGFKKFGKEECIRCHEYADFEFATKWFLKNF